MIIYSYDEYLDIEDEFYITYQGTIIGVVVA